MEHKGSRGVHASAPITQFAPLHHDSLGTEGGRTFNASNKACILPPHAFTLHGEETAARMSEMYVRKYVSMQISWMMQMIWEPTSLKSQDGSGSLCCRPKEWKGRRVTGKESMEREAGCTAWPRKASENTCAYAREEKETIIGERLWTCPSKLVFVASTAGRASARMWKKQATAVLHVDINAFFRTGHPTPK